MDKKSSLNLPLLAIVFALLVWKFFMLEPSSYPNFDLWVKALHVIAIISWMAGLLYLPRLFVYHSAVKKGSESSELFKTMEMRLLRYITTPAMLLSWITGLWLSLKVYHFEGQWLYVKLFFVFLLSGYHGFLSKQAKNFSKDIHKFSQKKWRFLNEVPTVLMIFIVILVIVKPFA